ncbi:outer membrane protein assembly factor BamB family protein [Zavarzinella formosa]|uniref:outer membrane protein assembly factor BamB family protein n=1 Tax=Zavarzinella formosa TaxID=360055 RepID=UPI0002D7819B|nr:PQQ-binding-like beta-propeller repeat protein [Zavarzinella formosa]
MFRYLPLLLLSLATVAVAEDAPWATFRGNAQRTGNTDGKAGPSAVPQLEWAMKSDEHFVASPVPSGDSVLFSAIGAFNRPNVLALAASPKDAKAVKPTWNKTAPFLRLPTVSSPAVIGDKIIFGEGMHQTDGAVLYCLPADGGFLLWALNVPGELVHMEGSPAISEGKVYVGGGSAGVMCVDLNTLTLNGKELGIKDIPALQADHWKSLQVKYEADKKKDPDFAIPPTEDQLLKPAPKVVWTQGKTKWHIDAPILVAGDKVLAASAYLDKEKLGERALFCLDAATGKEVWKAPLTLNPWGGPSVMGDTVIVTTSSISYDPKLLDGAKGEVIAIDLKTGKEKWKKNIPGGVLGCACLTKDAAIFTATDGKLRTFSLTDGARVSIYDCKAPVFAPPAVVGTIAYVPDLKGVLHAVDTKTGLAVWTLDLGKDPVKLPGMNYGGVTVHGGKIYLGTCNLEGDFARQPTAAMCLGGK